MGKHPPPKSVVFHDNEGGVFEEGVGCVKTEMVLGLPLTEEGKVVFLGSADVGVKIISLRGDMGNVNGAFDAGKAARVGCEGFE